MIATITAIAEKNKFSDRSDNNSWDRTFSISTIVVATIRAAISGEWFPYDHCDRWTSFFFVSDRSDHSDRTDHMETRLKRTDTYITLTDDLSLDRKCDPSQSGWMGVKEVKF